MRRLNGYATLVHPDMPTRERDTFTCCHCNSVRHVEPFGRGFLVMSADGVYAQHEYVRCPHCNDLICEQCVGQDCLPFEEKLKKYEQSAALYARIKQGG